MQQWEVVFYLLLYFTYHCFTRSQCFSKQHSTTLRTFLYIHTLSIQILVHSPPLCKSRLILKSSQSHLKTFTRYFECMHMNNSLTHLHIFALALLCLFNLLKTYSYKFILCLMMHSLTYLSVLHIF